MTWLLWVMASFAAGCGRAPGRRTLRVRRRPTAGVGASATTASDRDGVSARRTAPNPTRGRRYEAAAEHQASGPPSADGTEGQGPEKHAGVPPWRGRTGHGLLRTASLPRRRSEWWFS